MRNVLQTLLSLLSMSVTWFKYFYWEAPPTVKSYWSTVLLLITKQYMIGSFIVNFTIVNNNSDITAKLICH